MKLALTVPNSLLSEEPPAGITVGEEEEGVVSDPGTEILAEDGAKVKVKLCTQVQCDVMGCILDSYLHFLTVLFKKKTESLLLVVSANMTEREQDMAIVNGRACMHSVTCRVHPDHNVLLHVNIAHASNALFACVYSVCICECMRLHALSYARSLGWVCTIIWPGLKATLALIDPRSPKMAPWPWIKARFTLTCEHLSELKC